MGIESNIERLKKWLNEKPERKKDFLLAGCLTINLLITSVLVWFLGLMFSVPEPPNIVEAMLILFFFWIFAIIIIFGLFLLMYWQIRLTNYNLVGRLIEKAKEEEKINEDFKKENTKFEERFKEAYNINVEYFGKIIDLKNIELVICNSRAKLAQDISQGSSKENAQEILENKDLVGICLTTHWLEKLLTKRRFYIFMLSPRAFEKESNFSKNFAFNVFVHEICHSFIRSSSKIIDFLYKKKEGHISEEYLCYYIGNQKEYFKEEYEHGKRLYKEMKRTGIIN